MLYILYLAYFFPKMQIVVEDYIYKCMIYKQSKYNKHALYGLLQPL
jgi:hypothetical protein